MIVAENMWLDDNTFICDSKTMKREAIGDLKELPKHLTMNPNNREIVRELETLKNLTNFDILKVILKK